MLPIGVLLPTRDSMAHLPGHLQGVASWLDIVEEVVVVDSHSKDATIEFLTANLRHPGLRILTHPPGLYESWNHGIAHIGSRFTYISTIGDSITRAGLEQLVETAERLQCDVLISPPQFVDETGRKVPHSPWPVHGLISDLGIAAPRVLDRITVFFYACLHALSPGSFDSLLGSSASNVYRTSVLQEFPFPTDCARASDTAWSFLHSLEVNLGVTPEVCSTFLMHSRPAGPDFDFYAALGDKLLAHVLPFLHRELDRDPQARSACAAVNMNAFLDELQAWRRDHVLLRAGRMGRAPWFLKPSVWKARAGRTRHREHVESFKERFLALYRKSLQETGQAV
jgi:hypothetical protein